MEKFYNLLEWLDIDQAVEYLSLLTGTSMTPPNLMALCSKRHCSAYLAYLVEGESHLAETGEACRATASGIHHLINFPHPHTWASGEPWKFCVIGTVTQYDSSPSGGPLRIGNMRFGARVVEDCTWFVSLSADQYAPTFKKADIQSLAGAMNGTATQASELERLREALERAQAANKELQRELNVTEAVCEVAQREADELRSQWDTSDMVNHMNREELIERHQAELKKLKDDDSKSLDNRERASMERLIFVLAKAAKYKLENLHSDEVSIQAAADLHDAKVPRGKGSIVKQLRAAIARIDRDREEERQAKEKQCTIKA